MEDQNRRIFSINLSRLMSDQNISRADLSEKLQIKYSTLCEWLSAKKYPRIEKIEALAAFFGVPKSALIEEARDLKDTKLLDCFHKLNEAGQDRLIEYADDLANMDKYKKRNSNGMDTA